MKKILSSILVIMMLFIGAIALTGCEGNNPKGVTAKITAQPTYTKKSFKVEATVPGVEEKNANGEKEIKPNYTIKTSGLKKSNADVAIVGDKIEFDFDYTSFSYNTYADYKAKYGSKETSFDNYLEFLQDADFDSVKADQKNYEQTKFAGLDAIKYKFGKSMIFVIKCDKLDLKQRFECTVYPVNDEDKIEDLLADESIKSVIESFVIDAVNQ